MEVNFNSGGNMSSTRKPITSVKQTLPNTIVWSTHLYKLERNSQTVVMIGTDYMGRCKPQYNISQKGPLIFIRYNN